MNKWDVVMSFIGAVPGVAHEYFGMLISGDPNSMIVGALVLLGLIVMAVRGIRVWIRAIIHTQF